MTATSSSRVTAARPGRTSPATSPACRRSAWVSSIEASHFAAGTAYATFDLHTFGDMRPYVYRTTDFGSTWTPLVAPEGSVKGYAHVVKEDTGQAGAPLPRHGARPVDLARRRQAVGAVQGRQLPQRRRPRSRGPSRATPTSSSPRTAAASGSSTTSRRCERSPPTCSPATPRSSPASRPSSASSPRAAGATATPSSRARIPRATP